MPGFYGTRLGIAEGPAPQHFELPDEAWWDNFYCRWSGGASACSR